MTRFWLYLKYIPLYRDYCLFVLSQDILLYHPVIRSSLTSIANYPTVYTLGKAGGNPVGPEKAHPHLRIIRTHKLLTRIGVCRVCANA